MPGLSDLIALFAGTLVRPREAAAELLALDPPKEALAPALGLVAVLFMLFTGLFTLVALPETMQASVGIGGLISVGIGEIVSIAFLSGLTYQGGRLFGGTGNLRQSVAVVVWLEFVFIVLRILALLISLVIPLPAVLLIFVLVGLILWVTSVFVAVLHGFASVGKVALVVFAMSLVIGTVMMKVMGLSVPGV